MFADDSGSTLRSKLIEMLGAQFFTNRFCVMLKLEFFYGDPDFQYLKLPYNFVENIQFHKKYSGKTLLRSTYFYLWIVMPDKRFATNLILLIV